MFNDTRVRSASPIERITILTLSVLFFSLLTFSFIISCANKNLKHTTVVVDSSLYEVLNDTFVAEQSLLSLNTPAWTKEKSQAFNKSLLPAVAAGKAFNTILANWKSGEPLPVELHAAIAGISSALKSISTDMPEGTTKAKILSSLATAESIILSALDVILTLKG